MLRLDLQAHPAARDDRAALEGDKRRDLRLPVGPLFEALQSQLLVVRNLDFVAILLSNVVVFREHHGSGVLRQRHTGLPLALVAFDLGVRHGEVEPAPHLLGRHRPRAPLLQPQHGHRLDEHGAVENLAVEHRHRVRAPEQRRAGDDDERVEHVNDRHERRHHGVIPVLHTEEGYGDGPDVLHDERHPDAMRRPILRDEVPLPVGGLEDGEREGVDDGVVDGVGEVHGAVVEDLCESNRRVHDPRPGVKPAGGGGGAVERVFGHALREAEEDEEGDGGHHLEDAGEGDEHAL
mmetsp:Transcript_46998/g.111955  ORF Transcript_46998/g.111955 Transcript_46998/m.111955 type:complete len:292 (+) Transcript_46998:1083-1958(+)